MEFMAEDDVIESANHFRCIDRMIDPVKAALTEKLMKGLCLISKNSTSDSREDRFAVGEYRKLPNEVGGMDRIPYEQPPLERGVNNYYSTNIRTTNMLDLLIKNAIVVTMEPECEPFIGSVGIQDGRFAIVTNEQIREEARETVDGTGKILFPGMINGHVHGDMTVLRGLGDDLTLLEQNHIYSSHRYFLKDLSLEELEASRELTYLEAIRSGTTFILEHEYTSLGTLSVDAMKRIGIKGGISDDLLDHYNKPGDTIPEDYYDRFIQMCRENGILPIISSASEEFFNLEVLTEIGKFAARKQLLITQHFAENDWRMEHIKKEFNSSPVRLLYDNGILGTAPIVGSHCVYADKEEISIMAKSNFRVVNTPLCEMKIQDGIAPIPDYLKAGVPVGLGTDGGLWNNSNDLFREVKCMVLLHSLTSGVRSITARQALEMATLNGARVWGLENEIGSIKAGKCADFILISTEEPHMQPLRIGHYDNVLSMLAYCATGHDVDSTYINGNAIMKNRRMVGLDQAAIISRAVEAGQNCLSRYNGTELYRH